MNAAADRPGYVNGVETGSAPSRIEEAVLGAQAALADTRITTSHFRASVLDRIAQGLQSDAEEIARSIAAESGYLEIHDMRLEVQRAVEVFTIMAAIVRVGTSETINLDAVERARGSIGYIKREPVGPVLGITAYNGPLLIAAHKIAPAIAAGAPIVIKPSPRVPRSAIRLAKLVVASGWPSNAISVLDVDNEKTTQLVKDPRLPVVSFTGGEIGWRFKEMAPRKRIHLELGGVGAVIVAKDADIDQAIEECATGGLVRSGQSCISVQRIYVEDAVYREFVERFAAHVQRKHFGPEGVAVPIAPMVDDVAAKRVEELIADAVQKGASAICGGTRDGAYVAPTVLAGADSRMSVMRKEAFGPVIAISSVSSIDAAIEEVNAVDGAIHHGIYTRDIEVALGAADRIKAGGVIINGPGTWRVDNMPYGGTGNSGFGREGLKYALEEYTEPKVIVIRLGARGR